VSEEIINLESLGNRTRRMVREEIERFMREVAPVEDRLKSGAANSWRSLDYLLLL
jgi:hypothetical protein